MTDTFKAIEGIDPHSAMGKFIQKTIALTTPKNVYLCTGTQEEYALFTKKLVNEKVFIPLKRENSFLIRSHPEDVQRVEEDTFVCTETKEEAGPTNNWKDPEEAKKEILELFSHCMEGRTLYIIPFCMGPLHSPFSLFGIEITDSPYVVCQMHLMTRMGTKVLQEMVKKDCFIPCIHSVGVPLKNGIHAEKDPYFFWPCNLKKRRIIHFPESKEIWSFGSGYGGNALLGKKSLALRLASYLGKKEGWLAEHMLILGITNPQGIKKYIAAAFPSSSGKTNLALLQSKLKGWKIETIGDDIAWIRKGKDNRLYAINPEAGFFGVAPGTSYASNPIAMQMIEKNTLFTNVALTEDNDVWWEGMTPTPPHKLTDWKGKEWTPQSTEKAAHGNSRFTVSLLDCPSLDPAYHENEGVPLEAILFGGRREKGLPLVMEAYTPEEGVFLGAALSSEMTAASKGEHGKVRHDPFAMLPFLGYNMGDYFSHWLSFFHRDSKIHLPKVFTVNWFRKGENGKYLWPGFQENMHVLQWIFNRLEGKEKGVETVLGYIPDTDSFFKENISLKEEEKKALFALPKEEMLKEIEDLKKYFTSLGSHVPKKIWEELEAFERRV